MNKHILEAKDLITTYNERKSGFLDIALRKSKEAGHYVNLGYAFRTIVNKYSSPKSLIGIKDIKISLYEAAGVSTKARSYLEPKDLDDILSEFIDEYLLPKGNSYIDELISRYLLTQGDALGGRMRNIVGGLAGEKLTQSIISILNVRNYEFSYFDRRTKKWNEGALFRDDLSIDVKALRWKNGNKTRLLYYDLKVPIVNKNIDIVLFKNSNVDNSKAKEFKDFILNADNYLVLGELKGGIDPAGADEHWKTANTALDRIRTSFKKKNIDILTVFIGAAIEADMAKEIYNQFKASTLTNCANLTKKNQLMEVCDWLVCVDKN